MAKCDLLIELEGQGTYRAGEAVRGRLTVTANETVTCNLISIQQHWFTHGSGNIATGGGAQVNLYSGQLTAGETQSFEFELPLLPGPATYHGHHLNVDHKIVAHVDVPWAFDVKAEKPIAVIGLATTKDDAARETEAVTAGKQILWALLLMFLPLFIILFFVAIPLFLLLLPFAIIGGLFWLFGKVLPKWLVGPARTTLDDRTVALGSTLRGQFSLSPSRPLAVNRIFCELVCEEVCISGSGSNQKTHRHRVMEKELQLEPAGTVPTGKRSYPIEFIIPADAPPTLTLGQNKIVWTLQTRVDIPRWPDFVQIDTLDVFIDQDVGLESAETTATTEEEAYFAETAQFILNSRHKREQLEQVIAAVRGMEFPLRASIEQTVLYAGPSDQEYAYPNGRIAYAQEVAVPLALTLYFPPERLPELDNLTAHQWSGRGVVMGYDFQHERLQLRVINKQ
ncbi:sporulation protein [Planctomycetaceae bacterium SH139]